MRRHSFDSHSPTPIAVKFMQRGKAALRLLLSMLGASVLCALAWTARDELAQVFRSVDPGYFGAAVLLGTVFLFIQGVFFDALLAKHGRGSPARDVIAAFLLSQPGKYLPGKIWSAVMQSVTLGRKHAIANVAMTNVELVLVGMIHMGALGVAALLVSQPVAALATLAIGLICAASIMVLPSAALLSRLPTAIRRLLHLPDTGTDLSRGEWSKAIWLNALLGATNLVASLAVLLAAGDTIAAQQYPPILAVLYLGFAASFLTPVPAGIGVREAATVALGLALAPGIDAAIFISVALLARCWQLITDLACFVLGASMLAFRANRAS